MVIVASMVSPQIDLQLIDTLILQNEIKGIDSVLCINKSDLIKEEEALKLADVYEKAGYRTVITSAANKTGADKLFELLKGKITTFAGNSGVGKSSILNLLNENFMLETGSISRIERGRHTTRHVELLPLEGYGFVVDTPGFSRIELPALTADDLCNYFKEFDQYKDLCRFRGCTHISEPDCAVIDAVNEGKISASRYENYKNFYEKLKSIKKWKL